jgi:hypothetical protein
MCDRPCLGEAIAAARIGKQLPAHPILISLQKPLYTISTFPSQSL